LHWNLAGCLLKSKWKLFQIFAALNNVKVKAHCLFSKWNQHCNIVWEFLIFLGLPAGKICAQLIFKDLEIAFLNFVNIQRESFQNPHLLIIMNFHVHGLSLLSIDYKHALGFLAKNKCKQPSQNCSWMSIFITTDFISLPAHLLLLEFRKVVWMNQYLWYPSLIFWIDLRHQTLCIKTYF